MSQLDKIEPSVWQSHGAQYLVAILEQVSVEYKIVNERIETYVWLYVGASSSSFFFIIHITRLLTSLSDFQNNEIGIDH